MALNQKATLKTIVANSLVGADEVTYAAFKATAVAGETIAVEADGTVVAGGSDKIMIISKDGNGVVKSSEPIKVADLKRATLKAYVAPSEQVDYIGYNGTSGAIEVLNSNLYQANVEMANYGTTGSELRYRKQGHFMSPANSTQIGNAEGLRDSLIRNFKREPEQRILFEMVCDNAGDVLGTSVNNMVFTKGSTIVSAADIDDASGAGVELIAGALLRVGTAVTDPVYRIVSVDTSGNTLKLDQAFQGETVTIADTGVEQIPYGDFGAASFGIKLTGVAQKFSLGKIRHEKMSFVTQLVDMGATLVTKSTASKIGLGDGKVVAEEEWFSSGNYGELYRMGEPDLYDNSDSLMAVISNKYHVVSLEYVHKEETAFQEHILRRNINIYFNAGDGTDYTNVNAFTTSIDKLSSVALGSLS